MKNKPLVSVIMPLYNGEEHIVEAIESILKQTYQNIEIIVINDGSTDASEKIVKSINSSKIIYTEHKYNLGLPAARNTGIDLAKGKYIALMDGDDISLPTRIEKEVNFLEKYSEIGLVGSCYERFEVGTQGIKSRIKKVPSDSAEIKAKLLFSNVLAASSTMIRADVLKNNQLKFDISKRQAEDFDLWNRLSFVTKIANLDEVLLKYRRHSNNMSSDSSHMNREVIKVIIGSFDMFNLNIRELFNEEYILKDIESFLLLNKYLESILRKNTLRKEYEQIHLRAACAELLHWMFKKHIDILGYKLYDEFRKLPLYKFVSVSMKKKIKRFLKYNIRR